MKLFRRLCILLIFVSLSSACAAPSNVLLSEDFSSNSNSWDNVPDLKMTTNYYNDAYRILENMPNYDAWANPDDLSFTDVQIEVDAIKNDGPNVNDFGIICRYSMAWQLISGPIKRILKAILV